MQESYLSLMPPLLAITVAIWRKNALLALMVGIVTSCIMLNTGSLTASFLHFFYLFNAILSSLGNLYIIGFSLMIGVLVTLMNKSGAVNGFIKHLASVNLVKNKRSAALLPTFIGSVIFTDTNLSLFTAGTVSQQVFDQYKLTRAKLAYLIDSTCAPISILILINGWGAYILGLLEGYQLENPVSILLSTIQYNFYPILALILAYFTAFSGKTYGPLSRSMINKTSSLKNAQHEVIASPLLMWIPLISLIVVTLTLLFITGNGDFRNGSGSLSVFYAILSALVILIVLIKLKTTLSNKSVIKNSVSGIKNMLLPVSILVLSFVFSEAIKPLGTGIYLSQMINLEIPIYLIAPLLFIVAGAMAFATGTSWGTFAILIPIAIPIAITTGLPMPFLIGAVLGGGIFGDHASPISDTTVVASIASGCEHIEHVKTQLPYALFCAMITLIMYITLGFFV